MIIVEGGLLMFLVCNRLIDNPEKESDQVIIQQASTYLLIFLFFAARTKPLFKYSSAEYSQIVSFPIRHVVNSFGFLLICSAERAQMVSAIYVNRRGVPF